VLFIIDLSTRRIHIAGIAALVTLTAGCDGRAVARSTGT